MEDISVENLLAKLAGKMTSDSLAGLDGTLQLELTGEKVGIWHVVIKDERYHVNEGPSPAPTLTMTCDSNDFAELLTGRLDIMQSFMSGKLKISGDMSLAMRLAGNL